jgi:hypothetical protein
LPPTSDNATSSRRASAPSGAAIIARFGEVVALPVQPTPTRARAGARGRNPSYRSASTTLGISHTLSLRAAANARLPAELAITTDAIRHRRPNFEKHFRYDSRPLAGLR